MFPDMMHPGVHAPMMFPDRMHPGLHAQGLDPHCYAHPSMYAQQAACNASACNPWPPQDYIQHRSVESNAMLMPSPSIPVGPLTELGFMGGVFPMTAPPIPVQQASRLAEGAPAPSVHRKTKRWRDELFYGSQHREFRDLYFRPWLEKRDVDIPYANKFESRYAPRTTPLDRKDRKTRLNRAANKSLNVFFPSGYSSTSSDEYEEWYDYFRKTYSYRNRELWRG
eukprot:gnl/TRDRNA2_/TRDRNA2_44258_c0_seq1.p1 gnl/TRDRNA2_/TRDRNA2_44258_c0~~gnl/TRDRNA2_/TRDRNA2_44258_c0_seq1.p1  ORF type:complete len:224 (+),score=20.12 gnl/TRDRNA2_/TRDRNA2_44258_c0_seq1:70-741(+)